MLKKQKIIMVFIIVFIIICIILLASLHILKNKENQNPEDAHNNEIEIINVTEDPENYENFYTEGMYDKKLKNTSITTDYFTIKAIINNYINYVSYGNTRELMHCLSKNYINEYNITENNVLQKSNIKKVNDTRIYISLYIEDILEAQQNESKVAYIVNSKYRFSNETTYTSLYTIVVLDTNKKLYEIYPEEYVQEKGYDKLVVGDILSINRIELTEENNQKFSYVSATNRDLAVELFDNWKELVLYDKSNAYNKLNSEYKNSKFKNYESFKNYLTDQKYIPRINEYRTYSTTDYIDYVCTDQYNNYYIFRQQGGVMRYSVFLDSYTVELDTFKQNYDNGEESTKLAIQIGKFKQMLNSKDYNAIYNKLNNTFKQNNYSTVTKLENDLSKNIYDINTITIEDYSQNEDYYVCECLLQNQKNTNEQKNMTVVIKLIDSNNFEMSFSFNK